MMSVGDVIYVTSDWSDFSGASGVITKTYKGSNVIHARLLYKGGYTHCDVTIHQKDFEVIA